MADDFVSRRDWIDRARAVSIEVEISRRGIKLAGRGRNRCGPCPRCGGTDRFSINTAKRSWYCRGCGRGGGVVQLVQILDGCDIHTACETLIQDVRPAEVLAVEHAGSVRGLDGGSDDEITRRRASAIWREAIPIAGTLAERYLLGRGLDIPEGVSGRVLRFHPACPFGPGTRHPCMIGLFRRITGDEPVAIHRTPITPEAKKLGKPMSYGPICGAAIKLSPDVEVACGLAIGEGVETTLAGMKLGFNPAWAIGNAGGIGRFLVLSGIDALTILVDHDAAGLDAARDCRDRWVEADREVRCVISACAGEDLNDLGDLRATV